MLHIPALEGREVGCAYKTRNQKAEVAFRVEKGEWVRGIDGVVITHRYGVTKVLKQMELGYTKRGDKPVLSLQPGELVYTLHYLGEGSELFWYKGQVYSDQISAGKPDPQSATPGTQCPSAISSEIHVVGEDNKQGRRCWLDK